MLKTEIYDKINAEREREARELHAALYSKECKRKEMKYYVALILILLCIGLVGNIELHAEPEYKRDFPKAEPETVYIICDCVAAHYDDNGNAELEIEMQTGEVETYKVKELDFCPREVVFQTKNIDNFKTYEIVGLR